MRKMNSVRCKVFSPVLTVVILLGLGMISARGTVMGSLDGFLAGPTQSSWQAFETDVRAGRYSQKGTAFLKLLEYHDAREKRDLPNSMALVGIKPDEFVKLQSERADLALDSIKEEQAAEFWRLIQTLATQGFDEGLVWTAGEIAARLSPTEFESIATNVARVCPDRSWIMEAIGEKWGGIRRK